MAQVFFFFDLRVVSEPAYARHKFFSLQV
jgi:hypothetical protein